MKGRCTISISSSLPPPSFVSSRLKLNKSATRFSLFFFVSLVTRLRGAELHSWEGTPSARLEVFDRYGCRCQPKSAEHSDNKASVR